MIPMTYDEVGRCATTCRSLAGNGACTSGSAPPDSGGRAGPVAPWVNDALIWIRLGAALRACPEIASDLAWMTLWRGGGSGRGPPRAPHGESAAPAQATFTLG